MFLPRIKETRTDNDTSQKEIAEILGITQQQYSLYENGKRLLPIDTLRKFCLHYNVSADYILELPKGMGRPR